MKICIDFYYGGPSKEILELLEVAIHSLLAVLNVLEHNVHFFSL